MLFTQVRMIVCTRSVLLSTVRECQWSIIKFTAVSLELPLFGSYCASLFMYGVRFCAHNQQVPNW